MIVDVNIANAALRLIGAQGITNLNDGTDRAFDVNQYYQSSLEAFLTAFNWSFATREARLTRINTNMMQYDGTVIQEQISDEFKYGHTLPTDFLRLTSFSHPKHRIKYDIRLYRSQLAIFTDCEQLAIVYISKDINYDSMSAPARETLIFRLAMFLDSARNAGANLQRLNEQYQGAFHTAISLEPSTHNREYLDIGKINKVRTDWSEWCVGEVRGRDSFVNTPFPEIP